MPIGEGARWSADGQMAARLRDGNPVAEISLAEALAVGPVGLFVIDGAAQTAHKFDDFQANDDFAIKDIISN